MHAVFGGSVIELAGRVIAPPQQACGLGSVMLRSYIQNNRNEAEYIATYTRNPSVIKMMRKNTQAAEVYPLTKSRELQAIARQMPHATDHRGAVLHIGRYGAGLYGGSVQDPAANSIDGIKLSDQFVQLKATGNALVAVGRVRECQ